MERNFTNDKNSFYSLLIFNFKALRSLKRAVLIQNLSGFR